MISGWYGDFRSPALGKSRDVVRAKLLQVDILACQADFFSARFQHCTAHNLKRLEQKNTFQM
ncbi:MAG: hypothetical protein DRR08_26255 [Candidatus Parabeggiatoa sp. nov. 2]|nr:MAG: hypothetical protein B6247_24800 [Beggiatoa sp. 4572_84]RKZ54650.1 MAG: hypothetical protein DRR08_26255 [Gammaproteobacteria bacterium]